MSPFLEKIVYHYVRQRAELHEYVEPSYFSSKEISECFKIDLKYFQRYHKLPSKTELFDIAKINKKTILEDKEVLNEIFSVNLNEYDEQWLDENCQSWIEYKTLDSTMLTAINYIKDNELNVNNIHDTVEKIKSLILEKNNINFKFEKGLDFFNPDDHNQPQSNNFTTGYPYIDLMTDGGWELGSLLVLIGRPKIGKCCTGREKIRVRNKKTQEIIEIPIQTFFEKIKDLGRPK